MDLGGASFFVGGWAFLLLGHKIEGNHPAFFKVDFVVDRTNLGRKGSMGVPKWNAPYADFGSYFGKYFARHSNEEVVSDLGVRQNSGAATIIPWTKAEQQCARQAEMMSETVAHQNEELRKRRSTRIMQAVPLAFYGRGCAGR